MAVIQREGSKQIYYEDYGQGPSAVVMVHAWGLSCRAWDSNTRALAQAGFRVVAIDARGCGQSDKDFDTMTLEAVADDVVALVEALKLTDVVLNGWSFGGAVAVIAALGRHLTFLISFDCSAICYLYIALRGRWCF